MGKPCLMWMPLMAYIMLVSPVNAEYYNTTRLTTYVRLSQQLRNNIYDMMYDIGFRFAGVESARSSVNATLMGLIAVMYSTLTESASSIFVDANRIHWVPTPALKVEASDPYPDRHAMQFNVVDFDHNFGYSTVTGDATIKMAGVYLMEIKVHGLPGTLRCKVNVIAPDGSSKYTLSYLVTASRVQPFMEILLLDVGDRLDTVSFSGSGNLYWSAEPGPANQLNLRYLGKTSA